MGYNKTTWQTGDTVTAEKLNNMENGIENATNKVVVLLVDEYNFGEANQENYMPAFFDAGNNLVSHQAMMEYLNSGYQIICITGQGNDISYVLALPYENEQGVIVYDFFAEFDGFSSRRNNNAHFIIWLYAPIEESTDNLYDYEGYVSPSRIKPTFLNSGDDPIGFSWKEIVNNASNGYRTVLIDSEGNYYYSKDTAGGNTLLRTTVFEALPYYEFGESNATITFTSITADISGKTKATISVVAPYAT